MFILKKSYAKPAILDKITYVYKQTSTKLYKNERINYMAQRIL